MALSNAERQKRHRDRKRGSPVVGRWPEGYVSIAKRARVCHTTRTMTCMAGWILQHAPEFEGSVASGAERITPLYRRLKQEYDMGVFRALKNATPDQAGFNGWALVEGRECGRFVFKWVKAP
jgi:hypothetical protein